MINSIGDLGYTAIVDTSSRTQRLNAEDQLEKLIFSRILQPLMNSLSKATHSSAENSNMNTKMNSGIMINHVIDKMAMDMALNHDLGLVNKNK